MQSSVELAKRERFDDSEYSFIGDNCITVAKLLHRLIVGSEFDYAPPPRDQSLTLYGDSESIWNRLKQFGYAAYVVWQMFTESYNSRTQYVKFSDVPEDWLSHEGRSQEQTKVP